MKVITEDAQTATAALHPNGNTRIKQAAAIVGVSPITLRRWWQAVPAKFMKPTNINGVLVFKNSQLIEWLEKQHSDDEVSHDTQK